MNDLKYFINLATEVFRDRGVKKKIEYYSEIDMIIDCDYELPEALREVSWLQGRKFVSTAPADSVNAAGRAFAERMPILNIQPLSNMPEEYARVERLETALEWDFKKMNARGTKPAHWQIVESAMKYCKVALQTEYMPYMFKGRDKDNYVKAVLKSGNFNWRVHHPSTVFCQTGPYGVPEFVVSRTKRTVNWIVSKFGKDNKGVKKMLSNMKEDDLANQLKQEVYYYDVMTWEERAQWASFTEVESSDSVSGDFEFLREKHNQPFMNWVIVDYSDFILKGVIDADLWKNSNALRTMTFAKAVDVVAHPSLWIQTVSGDLQDVNRAEDSPNEALVTGTTTRVQELRPPQIDPQLENIRTIAESEIFRTTVAQILASVQDIGKTATFSTVNAMLQAAVTQLTLSKSCAESAEQQAFSQNLLWVNYSKIDWVVYRNKSKTVGGTTYPAGQEIIVTKSMDVNDIPPEHRNTITPIEPENLYITVSLQPKAITDKQAEQTMAINQYERLGGSLEMLYDDFGFGDYSQHEQRRGLEDLSKAEVESEQKRILMQPDLEAQQMQMEQQMAQQQEMQQQQMAAESARQEQQNSAFAGTQGFDPRSGGLPPAAAAPGMGREQVTGETVAGDQLA